jgi:hypothetical protein
MQDEEEEREEEESGSESGSGSDEEGSDGACSPGDASTPRFPRRPVAWASEPRISAAKRARRVSAALRACPLPRSELTRNSKAMMNALMIM